MAVCVCVRVYVCMLCMYAWCIYYEEDPEDKLQVVDGVQSDDDDEGDEVVLLADVEDGLEAVPEADRHERDHRREDVPILKNNSHPLRFQNTIFYNSPCRITRKYLLFIWSKFLILALQ